MKKFIPVILLALAFSGCGAFEQWVEQIGPGGDSGKSGTARKQLDSARSSFEARLKNSEGKSLTELRDLWQGLEPGVSQGGLTVFQWRQTAQITAPKGEVNPGASSSGTATVSCLAMFIVDPYGVVVDAASEGQCFDFRKMPAWRPNVTQSTGGRTGAAY